MIERFIYTAIKEGIDIMKASPGLVEDLFIDQHGLSISETEAIKTLLAAKPPAVIHQYPRQDATFPLYSIVLGNESESRNFLSDDGGAIWDDSDPDYPADIRTAFWTHSYQIMTYTEHPDVCLYYYEMLKSIMISSHPYFSEQGMSEMGYAGADVAPDPRYVPEHLFLRQLTFTCQREFQRLDKSKTKAFSIEGIYLNNAVTLASGVTAGVTPADE